MRRKNGKKGPREETGKGKERWMTEEGRGGMKGGRQCVG